MPNWYNLVPFNVAKAQTAWERRHSIFRVKNQHKIAYHRIGAQMGISKDRVVQLYLAAKRDIERNDRSPIEMYLNGFEGSAAFRHLSNMRALPKKRDWLILKTSSSKAI